MSIVFVPSQTGAPLDADFEPWNGNPIRQCLRDLALIWRIRWHFCGIFLPISLRNTNRFGEYHLSPRQAYGMVLMIVSGLVQLAFLLSIPALLFAMVPGLIVLIYCAVFLFLNHLIFLTVNGNKPLVYPNPEITPAPGVEGEFWVFINGMATGGHSLQRNVDRLSITFGRPVIGVLNLTYGPIFDLIQCVVQRNFNYATDDVRDAYRLIKEALTSQKYHKVVFIAHSQGAIMASLMINWLLAEIPRNELALLEVYTFGNAANHFSNPWVSDNVSTRNTSTTSMRNTMPATQKVDGGSRNDSDSEEPARERSIGHIEHYANEGDFVAQLGVLAFANTQNRYMGRIFRIPTNGHLMNQHYMDNIFPLDESGMRARPSSPFLNKRVTVVSSKMRDPIGRCHNRFSYASPVEDREGMPDVVDVQLRTAAGMRSLTSKGAMHAISASSVTLSGTPKPKHKKKDRKKGYNGKTRVPAVDGADSTGEEAGPLILQGTKLVGESLDAAAAGKRGDGQEEGLRVRDLSRLSLYLNGGFAP